MKMGIVMEVKGEKRVTEAEKRDDNIIWGKGERRCKDELWEKD